MTQGGSRGTHSLQVDRLWLLAVVLRSVLLLFHVYVFTEQQVDDENIVQLRARLGITLWRGEKYLHELVVDKRSESWRNGCGSDFHEVTRRLIACKAFRERLRALKNL